jgi:hypothetical protein
MNRGVKKTKYLKMSFIIRTHQILSGGSNQGERDGRGMWHIWGTGEVLTGFWWVDLMERDLQEVRLRGINRIYLA